MTAALQHTHAPGNVGLRGEATCPACRASGRTLAPEQAMLVDELLDGLGRRNDPADLVRVALIEAVLRGAEQQRYLDRWRLDTEAAGHEQTARNLARAVSARYEDDPTDSLGVARQQLDDAARYAQAARALRRVTL